MLHSALALFQECCLRQLATHSHTNCSRNFLAAAAREGEAAGRLTQRCLRLRSHFGLRSLSNCFCSSNNSSRGSSNIKHNNNCDLSHGAQRVAIATAIGIAIGQRCMQRASTCVSVCVSVCVCVGCSCSNYSASPVIDVLSRFLEKTVLFARRSLWFVL